MLTASSFRLCSKWLKLNTINNVHSKCSAVNQKADVHASGFLQLIGKNCSWFTGRNILSEIGNQKFSTESKSVLHVGEKSIVNMTITADMVKCFAQATGDWNPIHFEAGESIPASENCNVIMDKGDQRNRAPIVHGALLNGIVSGVIGTKLPGPGTIVVSQVYKFTAPLHVGSEVAVEVEVMDFKRREVNVRYKIVSVPEETVVMDGTARLMVPRGRIIKVS